MLILHLIVNGESLVYSLNAKYPKAGEVATHASQIKFDKLTYFTIARVAKKAAAPAAPKVTKKVAKKAVKKAPKKVAKKAATKKVAKKPAAKKAAK